MTVSRSRSSAPWVIGIAALVTILLVVIAIAVMQGDPDEAVAAGPGKTVGKEKVVSRPARPGRTAPARTGSEGLIRDLRVWHYQKNFQSLAELRAAWEEENTGENPGENGGKKIGAGMLDLTHGGKDACGLVWEGYLVPPDPGWYDFKLKASSGAALVIFGEEQMASKSGDLESQKILLRRGHNRVRVEYFQQEGEARPALDLLWSGPGLAGELSLVRTGGGRGVAVVGNAPEPATPEPVVERERPKNISQERIRYWSFDRRPAKEGEAKKVEKRFTKDDDGVKEKLITKGQPLRYLRPAADPGSLTRWTEREFDDSADWLDGRNGIGYEDVPADFKDLLETRIETEKGKHPHSLYLRIPFEVKDPEDYKGLALFIRYDDGFRASLNGSVVGSRNNPPFPFLWNSGSAKKRNDSDAVKAEAVPLGTRRIQQLVPGTNILAIHALNDGEKSKPNATNTGCASTDMLILAELVGLRKDSELPKLPEEPVIRKPSPHDFLIEESMKKGTVELTEGRFGEAYDFQGGSLDIGDKNEFAIADRSYTLSLWFTCKPPDGRVRGLISAGGGPEEMAGWALWIEGDGSGLTFRVGDGSEGFDLSVKHDSLENEEWHHVAVTIERDSREVCLFLDGERKDSLKVEALAGKTIGSPLGLSIGRTSDTERYHLGKIDDVVLWSRALLPVEIKEIFQSGEESKPAGDLLDAESPE